MLTYLILRISLIIKFNQTNALIHTFSQKYQQSLDHYNLMIVPDFKLKQNDTHIIVYIRVPYIKVAACEFYIETQTFKFFLKPYLLSLAFQQPLKEVEEPSKAIYYHQKYTLEVHLEKLNAGEHFSNLDLLTNILSNKKKKKNKVKVEVVNSEGASVVVEEEQSKVNVYNYGFGMNYSDVLDNLDEQAAELFEFDPRAIALPQRLPMSQQILIKEFDYDSYLYDKYDNKEEIMALLSDPQVMEHVEQQVKERQGENISNSEFKLKMKGKELLLSKELSQNVWTEIISIAFSYLYELICIGGDFGVQSAKTINRTSLVLSSHSFYHHMSLKNVLINCNKRCMTFSLYKSLLICKHTIKLLTKILDKRYLIAVMLDLRKIFESSQPRYLLNQLFIDDYLLFLYSMEGKDKLETIRKQLTCANISEEDLNLNIKEYEQMEVQQDEEQVEKIEPEGQTTPQQKEATELAKQFEKLNTLD